MMVNVHLSNIVKGRALKNFMDDQDFLLSTKTGEQLFHSFAEDMPIVDYHCHISPEEIFEDKRFKNITEVWLGGDHYKWRLMRANGVDERYITGDAPDREKFQACSTVTPPRRSGTSRAPSSPNQSSPAATSSSSRTSA